MTSSRLFFNLLRENIKRQMGCIVLGLITIFFYFPVSTALIGRDYGYSAALDELGKLDRKLANTEQVLHWYLPNSALLFLTIISAVVLAVSIFRYLHSPRMVDCYHAIPVKREMLFASRYLTGVVLYAGMYLIGIFATILTSLFLEVKTSYLWVNLFYSFFVLLLTFLLVYTITIIAMLLTGKVLMGIIGTAFLSLYALGTRGLYSGLCSLFFSNYSNYADNNILENTRWLSPVSRIALNMELVSEKPRNSFAYWYASSKTPLSEYSMKLYTALPVKTVLAMLFVLAALIAVAVVLMKKRSSECAGKTMAFAISRPIIKLLTIPVAATAISVFFYVIGNESFGWMIFGAVCGAILTACGLEVIFEADVKAIFRKKGETLIGIAITAVICIVFQFDLFGYGSYIPKKSNLEAVSLEFGFDNWANWYYCRDYREFCGATFTDIEKAYPLLDYLAKAEPYDEDTTEWAGLIDVEASEVYEKYISEMDMEYPVYRQTSYVEVAYQKKHGGTVYRRYRFDFSDPTVCELIDRIYSDREYKEKVFSIYRENYESRIKEMVLRSTFQEYSLENRAKMKEFLDIYRKEFGELSMTEAIRQKTPYKFFVLDEDYSDIEYPVYECFTESVAWLEKNIIQSSDKQNMIRGGELMVHRDYEGKDIQYVINEPEAIRKLMEHAYHGNVYGNSGRKGSYYMYGTLIYDVTINGQVINSEENYLHAELYIDDMSEFEQYKQLEMN